VPATETPLRRPGKKAKADTVVAAPVLNAKKAADSALRRRSPPLDAPENTM